MEQLNAKTIVDWLKMKLGEVNQPFSNTLWIEDQYAFGDTEAGFSSGYTIDYDALLVEMDKWIADTFEKKEA